MLFGMLSVLAYTFFEGKIYFIFIYPHRTEHIIINITIINWVLCARECVKSCNILLLPQTKRQVYINLPIAIIFALF